MGCVLMGSSKSRPRLLRLLRRLIASRIRARKENWIEA
jgi:hypothetical protein